MLRLLNRAPGKGYVLPFQNHEPEIAAILNAYDTDRD
jgi:hypothetical protein